MQAIKYPRKVKNPCYDEKTKTDCKRRAVGCRETCKRHKIYKTLKKIEDKQRKEAAEVIYLDREYTARKARRLRKMQGIEGWNK